MKRRIFLKNTSSAIIGTTMIPGLMASENEVAREPKKLPALLSDLSLTSFERDLEETPCLVSNGKGSAWLFSLRRLPWPRQEERISCFQLEGDEWKEKAPVTPRDGFYETPSAACAPGGKPVVAWIGIEKNNQWNVFASILETEGFSPPQKVSRGPGKASNPKMTSPEKGKILLVWENYHQGKFSAHLSIYRNNRWSPPQQVTPPGECCLDPSVAWGKDGKIYLVYAITDGVHQNIQMNIIDENSLSVLKTVPVFTGGKWKNRVNLNTKPALAFDKFDRLWISWENNKDVFRLEDSDCYTGDRACSMVCYQNGRIHEPLPAGKWLFEGANDHLPAFFSDPDRNLYVITRCGGDFNGKDYGVHPFWSFRMSWLDDERGWKKPVTILETQQKGASDIPAAAFSDAKSFWLAWRFETRHIREDGPLKRTKLNLSEFSKPSGMDSETKYLHLVPATTEFYHRKKNFNPLFSGRKKFPGKEIRHQGVSYSVLFGCLHEHTEGSYCWPAGTDGTLHDDYRFGFFSEGLDFMGITDHSSHLDEPSWRKNLRVAGFYNDNAHTLAIPAFEWTKSPPRGFSEIPHGVGHRNVIFASDREAKKFIKDNNQIFSELNAETANAEKLWQFIRKRGIDCVSIPHHIHDEVHPVDWQIRDETLEPIIELFQCRGSSEYPGCPRESNVSRHRPLNNPKVYADYALREKGYKIGFIASGDHNGIGVGTAVALVKEKSRKGLLEAFRARRCYATTGEKIFLDFKINNALMGETIPRDQPPTIRIYAKGTHPLEKVELLRNSRVLKTFKVPAENDEFSVQLTDKAAFSEEKGVLYYYVRVTQKNAQLAWSSPIWLE